MEMQALELKVPPPVVGLLLAVAMWKIAQLAPSTPIPSAVRVVTAAILAFVGLALVISAAVAFWRAGTTINPMKPATASSLVRSGIYRFTRNPIYVGDVFFLLAWAAFLSSAWTLLGPLLFALYMDRFQIVPEERALAERFGAGYEAYCARVRRWL